MTSEEVTALADFINEYDPRHEAQPLYGILPSVLCIGRNGKRHFYSISGYAADTRQVKDVPEFTPALEQWLLSQRKIAE